MATKNLVTLEFRASFVNVFRPQRPMPGDEDKKPKYSITMLFPKGADLSAMKAMARQAAVDKWGPDTSKWPGGLRNPFRDQGDKPYEGYVAGCVYVTATSDRKPGLVDAQMNPIIEEADFYSGCYARASVRAFAYDKKGNRGIAFGLQNVQKIKDGEPLGGYTRPTDDFQPVEVPGETPKNTKTSDDLPF